MEVFVYKINGNEIYDEKLKKYYLQINSKKRKQINQYVNSFEKSRCFVAHLIVYLYYKENINYEHYTNGEILNNNSIKYFNISYSDNYIVIAFNNNKIGIDIEKNNQIDKKELDYYATNSEKQIFKNKSEYTKLWSLKESYFKYLKSRNIDSFKTVEFIKKNDKYLCKNNFDLYIKILKYDKYYISIITKNKPNKINIKFINYEDII